MLRNINNACVNNSSWLSQNSSNLQSDWLAFTSHTKNIKTTSGFLVDKTVIMTHSYSVILTSVWQSLAVVLGFRIQRISVVFSQESLFLSLISCVHLALAAHTNSSVQLHVQQEKQKYQVRTTYKSPRLQWAEKLNKEETLEVWILVIFSSTIIAAPS